MFFFMQEYSLYHEHAYNAILLAQQLYMGLSRTSYNNQEIYLMGGWTRLREDGRVPIYYSLWAWVGASNYRVVIEGSIHEPGKFSLVDDYVEILGNLLPKYLCNERCLPDREKRFEFIRFPSKYSSECLLQVDILEIFLIIVKIINYYYCFHYFLLNCIKASRVILKLIKSCFNRSRKKHESRREELSIPIEQLIPVKN